MKTIAWSLLVLVWSASVFAQSRADATLRITVVDASGGVIVGARVTLRLAPIGQALAQGGPVRPAQGTPMAAPVETSLDTGARGDAVFAALEPGRYSIHVESPGFEPSDTRDVRVRAGDNRREVKLAIARLAETVQVGRDAS